MADVQLLAESMRITWEVLVYEQRQIRGPRTTTSADSYHLFDRHWHHWPPPSPSCHFVKTFCKDRHVRETSSFEEGHLSIAVSGRESRSVRSLTKYGTSILYLRGFFSGGHLSHLGLKPIKNLIDFICWNLVLRARFSVKCIF